MSYRFRMNPQRRSELARELRDSGALLELGESVKAAMERETPIGETGDTIEKYYVRVYPTMVRIGNRDFAFHLTEFGSKNNPPYAPMRRALQALGIRLVDRGPQQE